MIAVASLRVHLLEVSEEVRIYFLQEEGLSGQGLLQKHKSGGGYPIDEGTSGPGVCEGKVEELEDLEEGPESVY